MEEKKKKKSVRNTVKLSEVKTTSPMIPTSWEFGKGAFTSKTVKESNVRILHPLVVLHQTGTNVSLYRAMLVQSLEVL